MNKSTIDFKIRNATVELKDVCYQCGYLNPKATAHYKCHVKGSCPAIAVHPKPAPLSPISFAIGTEVLVKDQRRRPSGKNIVSDVSIATGRLSYAVNGCAWFSHDDLEYIAPATLENVEAVLKSNDEEHDSNEDFGDDEDDES